MFPGFIFAGGCLTLYKVNINYIS